MVYKCRRCGGLVRNTHVPDIMFGVISGVTDSAMPWGKVHMLSSHICPDDAHGVTDLIGGEPCGPTCCYPNKPEVTP